MFCYELVDMESFGARAVNVVQIERRRIRIGDSNTKRLDGLVLVTRPIRDKLNYERAGRRSRVATKAGEWEGSDSGSGEDEAGGSSLKKPGRCHGIQPKEEREGGTTLAAAGVSAREPKGRGLEPRDKARLWNDGVTVAALEFAQPPPRRKGTGAWRPKGEGSELRAEGRGGAAALSPPGRQSLHQRPEDPPGRAFNGWGNPAKPPGVTAGGTTLPEEQEKSGAQPGAFFAWGKVGLAKGPLPADGRPQVFPGHRADQAAPPSRGPDQPAGSAGSQQPRA